MALSVTGLTKHYDSGFTLDDVTFDLPSGYIMGLVGPNGAGKSTLIKLILNMTTRDAGRIEALGLDAMADEGVVQNIQGKGTFVMDKGNELMQRQLETRIRESLAEASRGAKAAGIPLDALDRMLEEEYRKE